MKKKILYIGNMLSKHGFSLSTIETLGPLLEAEDFLIIYSSNKKNPISRLCSMLYSIIANRNAIDVVLIDTYSTSAFFFAWASARVASFFKIKYLPILHGGNLPYRIHNSPLLSKQIFANSFTNIVISGYLQKSMEENGYKFSLIPNNIDLSKYKFLYRSKTNKRILWVRAFHATYNPQLAIHLISKLKQNYPDITLTMIGPEKDGSLELCKKLSIDLGVERQITFTGKLSNADWLARSEKHDIFINTTNFDNLPVSLIEAMALGMPIVSTNVGGVPYLINSGENGLLVAPDNVDEMAANIVKLFESESLVRQLSSNARQTAEQYDWEIIKEKWTNLLGNI